MATKLAAAALLLALPAAAFKPTRAPEPRPSAAAVLIGRAEALIAKQAGLPADEIRALDKQLLALDEEAAKLPYTEVPILAAAAQDSGRPAKLRLFLVSYLERMAEPAAFPALKRLAADASMPDLLREAAARALFRSPVSIGARAGALCAALAARPQANLRREVLSSLAQTGCDDLASLEEAAKLKDSVALAVTALTRSPQLAALDALERLYAHHQRGSQERALVLEALLARLPQLRLDRARWAPRLRAFLAEEASHPLTAAPALALASRLPDEKTAEQAARFLLDRDGRVVVAAAEAAALLRYAAALPAVQAAYDGFYTDPRFANAPGLDPTALYERLGAALKALK